MQSVAGDTLNITHAMSGNMEIAQAEREYLNDLPDFTEFDPSALRSYDPNLDYTEYAFIQPDGTALGVSYPGKNRKQLYYRASKQYHSFRTFINRHRPNTKCHTKFHLWKGRPRKQFVICIDIDALTRRDYRMANFWGAIAFEENPYEFRVKLGFVELAKEIQKRIGNKGYVFNSVKSGRPKILMVVEYEEARKWPCVNDLKELCFQFFPEYAESGCIEFTRNAFSSTFFPWEKRFEIRDVLPRLEPIKISKSAEHIIFKTAEEERVASSTFKYLIAHQLPAELDTNGHTRSFKTFLKMLCTMSGLAKKGFGISQKVVARTLNIEQTTASTYIRKAIQLGYLTVENDWYEPGKRAKIYKARGALRRFIKEKISAVLATALPRRIRKKEWHKTIVYYGLKCFRTNPDGFLKWVKTIRDHDVGDRWQQAVNFHKWLVENPLPKAT